MAISEKLNKFKNSAQKLFDKFFYENEEEAAGAEDFQEQSAQPYAGQPYAQQVNAARTVNAPYGQPVSRPVQQQTAPQAQMPVFNTQQAQQVPAAPLFTQPQQAPQQRAFAPQADIPQYNSVFRSREERQQAEQPAAAEGTQVASPAAAPAPVTLGQASRLPGIRVMCVRTIADCRASIALLRQGDAVLISMEGLSDANVMRRLVDTLSGACFSLSATITKVSRYGAYLMAPSSTGVYCDSVISRMNMPVRPRPVPQEAVPAGAQDGAAPRHRSYSQQIMEQGFRPGAQETPAEPERAFSRTGQEDLYRPEEEAEDGALYEQPYPGADPYSMRQ